MLITLLVCVDGVIVWTTQEILQSPEPGALVGTEEVSTPVIELASISAIEQMIQTGQSHCSINGIVLQNGVTTTQVRQLFVDCLLANSCSWLVGHY